MGATIPSNMPRGVSGYKSPNKSSYITNYNMLVLVIISNVTTFVR